MTLTFDLVTLTLNQLECLIDIDKMLTLNQGQGHKVKGQGHISLYDCLRWTEIDKNSIDGGGLR